MKKILLFILTATPLFAVEFFRGKGESSFKALKLNLSPRSTALAGAGSASSLSPMDIDLNTSSLARDSGSVQVIRGVPFQEFKATDSRFTLTILIKKIHMAIDFRQLTFEPILGISEDEYVGTPLPTDAYGAQTFKAQLALAGGLENVLSQAFHWGVGLNFAGNQIGPENYTAILINGGLSLDLSKLLSHPAMKNFLFSLSGQNLDIYITESKTELNPIFAPTTIQVGLTKIQNINNYIQTSLHLDARGRNDEDPVIPIGVELQFFKMLSARIGYPLLADQGALCAGAGLQGYRFNLDYAWESHPEMGAKHLFGLSFRY